MTVPAPLPWYAVDLLLAAKLVDFPPVNSTPESRQEYMERLGAAISAFEASMPVVDGVLQEYGRPTLKPRT